MEKKLPNMEDFDFFFNKPGGGADEDAILDDEGLLSSSKSVVAMEELRFSSAIIRSVDSIFCLLLKCNDKFPTIESKERHVESEMGLTRGVSTS